MEKRCKTVFPELEICLVHIQVSPEIFSIYWLGGLGFKRQLDCRTCNSYDLYTVKNNNRQENKHARPAAISDAGSDRSTTHAAIRKSVAI